jgi:hypothetical protein
VFRNSGSLSKFLITLFGAAQTYLSLYYSSARWEPAAVALMTGVLVYLVPNAPVVPVQVKQ